MECKLTPSSHSPPLYCRGGKPVLKLSVSKYWGGGAKCWSSGELRPTVQKKVARPYPKNSGPSYCKVRSRRQVSFWWTLCFQVSIANWGLPSKSSGNIKDSSFPVRGKTCLLIICLISQPYIFDSAHMWGHNVGRQGLQWVLYFDRTHHDTAGMKFVNR